MKCDQLSLIDTAEVVHATAQTRITKPAVPPPDIWLAIGYRQVCSESKWAIIREEHGSKSPIICLTEERLRNYLHRRFDGRPTHFVDIRLVHIHEDLTPPVEPLQ